MNQWIFTFALAFAVLPLSGAMSLEEVARQTDLKVEFSSDGRTELHCAFTSKVKEAVSVEVPIGLVAQSGDGQRIATIRAASVQLPPRQIVDLTLPIVPLASSNGIGVVPFSLSNETIGKLQPLFKYSSDHNDLPRATAQLTALILLENVNLARWENFLRKDPLSSFDVTVVIDALGLAQKMAPDVAFDLAKDPELRLRAIRNPISRPKAMKLFGLEAPDGISIPSIDSLLHTGTGDNCPICRLRAKTATGGNGL